MSKSIQLKKGTEKYYVHPYFPIGSIYMNISNINPSTYFGGTWERLKDRFLLAVGDVYKTANATGGSSSVTLTISQIPNHTHTFTGVAHNHGLNNHSHSFSATTNTTGSHQHRLRLNLTDKVNIQTGDFINYGGYGLSSEYNWSGYEGNHNHTISGTTGGASGNTANATQGGTNSKTGGGGSHENMPPYLTVYMWKRTA